MGPDETLSPALLKKVTHAAASSASFAQASDDLRVLAEVEVSANRFQRAALRVGGERIEDRRAAADAYRELPLPNRQQSPGPAPPAVACIQADGGRIQIRPRRGDKAASPDTWWRETKVGCLLSMTSQRHAEDPTLRVPETFVDRARMAKIWGEIKGFSATTAVETAPAEGDPETSPQQRVADALRYLNNQRTRMNYPEYRRQGLPITSSHVESTIKRINRRMKGTEKFGSLPVSVGEMLRVPLLDSDWHATTHGRCPQRGIGGTGCLSVDRGRGRPESAAVWSQRPTNRVGCPLTPSGSSAWCFFRG